MTTTATHITDLRTDDIIRLDSQNWMVTGMNTENDDIEIIVGLECVDGNVGQELDLHIDPDATVDVIR